MRRKSKVPLKNENHIKLFLKEFDEFSTPKKQEKKKEMKSCHKNLLKKTIKKTSFLHHAKTPKKLFEKNDTPKTKTNQTEGENDI